jgi:hypothetical protein
MVITTCLRGLNWILVGQEEEEDEEDETRKILDVGELSAEEARYLLHKLLAMTVNQTCLATQKEGRIRHARAIRENCLRHMEKLPQNNVRNLGKIASEQLPKCGKIASFNYLYFRNV